MDSIGKPYRCDAQGLKEDGNIAAVGDIGELVAAVLISCRAIGTTRRLGYALASGWYHTGDQAYMDAEGFSTSLGVRDLLKVGATVSTPRYQIH